MRRVLAFGLFAAGCGPEAIAVARAEAEPAPPVVVPARAHELRGDPAAAEREIFAVADAELAEDLLLGLPGSHGLPVSAQAMGRVPIAEGGHAIGTPEGGTLEGGVQLPFDPALYTRRDATRSYATTQTLRTLQAALGRLRSEKGFDAEVIIGDISLPRGGSFAPHVSHTSGRDIDIRLILAPGLDRTTLPLAPEQVDWDATWELVHGFLETGQVTYVFLDFAQQGQLYRAGERAGMHPRVLDRWFQWPDATKDDAIVRHEPGHRAHLHVRLGCAGQGPRCKGA
ncbi:MAG TPA: penicillin-insensitive murein endopeptidase [Nannocystaceae bacterium]|nr:penicillin-insensitive murein endopeptidase [Nannocystaceae bacterium]